MIFYIYLGVINFVLVKINPMKTNDIFNLLHNAVESKFFGKKISQREMAERLGISMRTYQDWRLGNSKPQAAIAIFKMLSELEDEEVLRITKRIRSKLKENE